MDPILGVLSSTTSLDAPVCQIVLEIPSDGAGVNMEKVFMRNYVITVITDLRPMQGLAKQNLVRGHILGGGGGARVRWGE